MKYLYLIIALFLGISCMQKKPLRDLKIINISEKQLQLFNRYQHADTALRNKIFIDSIYIPYEKVMNGYIGNKEFYLKCIDKIVYDELDIFNDRSKNLDFSLISQSLFEVAKDLSILSGHEPKGEWYIFFGPKWTNQGGFGDGTMIIDIAHPDNNSHEEISFYFPHEINHQIYDNVNPNKEYTVISRVIDEGFACFINHKYFNNKFPIHQSLGYTKEDFLFCKENDEKVLALLGEYLNSNNIGDINKFASRAYHFSENHPSAIGYYIGYRIVEEYVKKHGGDSWKHIYTIHPMEVVKKSGLLKLIST